MWAREGQDGAAPARDEQGAGAGDAGRGRDLGGFPHSGSVDPSLTADTARIAAGFGVTVPAPVLVCTLLAKLPVSITTRWQRAGARAEAQ